MVDSCRRRDIGAGLEPTGKHMETTVELVTIHLRRLNSKTA
jgi:hypothetical protein